MIGTTREQTIRMLEKEGEVMGSHITGTEIGRAHV